VADPLAFIQNSKIGIGVIRDELENHDKNTPKIFHTNTKLTKQARELIENKNAEGYSINFLEEDAD
jgi:hypothetical protein